MAEPGLILPYLSRYFNVPMPNYVVEAPLPSYILGLYDADTMTIYFRDLEPSIDVITHEFGHHLHTVYGIKGRRSELENLANKIEKALTEFYGQEPKVYSMNIYKSSNIFMVLMGVILILNGFRK